MTPMEEGSPTIAMRGRASLALEVGEQGEDADAADFFVGGAGEVEGDVEGGLGVDEAREGGEDDGEEAFHVGGASAVETAVLLGEDPGVGGPVLAFDGDDIGVGGEGDAGEVLRADGGVEVGFVGLVHDAAGFDAEGGEVVLDEFDEGDVGVPAGAVEGDELAEEVEGLGWLGAWEGRYRMVGVGCERGGWR